jgi:Uma2 family endonuclease
MKYPDFRFMEIPDGDTGIYELMDGMPVRKPSNTSAHQKVSGKILMSIFEKVKLKDLGHVFHAPFDVVFDSENALVPDLIFISSERQGIIDPDGPIMGAPDLIIEIISPGTARYDRGDKKDLYERFQVKEYWIADPKNASIEVYDLVEGRYKLVSYAASDGEIESQVLPGLGLRVEEVF